MEGSEVQATVRDLGVKTGLVTVADEVGDRPLLETLGEPGGAIAQPPPSHRLATVVDAEVDELPEAMPPYRGSLHSAIHRLSAGGSTLAPPETAFVAHWGRTHEAGFVWNPVDLVYILGQGSCVIIPEAAMTRPSRRDLTNSARHRRLALLLAHVGAAMGLILAKQAINSDFIRAWAEHAAKRLGRLYGPAPAADDYWGLEARHFLDSSGINESIKEILGIPLRLQEASPKTHP